jgi:hypothetical protein
MRKRAKELFGAEGKKELEFGEGEGIDYFDEEMMPITTNHYLYLSGTPFRAIASGEFIEEQIFNWTYSDEQRAKNEWGDKNLTGFKNLLGLDDNPYAALPRMVMLTYQLPDSIMEIVMKGEFNEFDLNVFFSADGDKRNARFKYEDEVQKWLDLIRGSFAETSIDNLKMGAQKPPFPFSHTPLLNVLNHTFWFLPNVASCYAMDNLLRQRQNKFYHDYKVVIAAGTSAGIGVNALPPVLGAMTGTTATLLARRWESALLVNVDNDTLRRLMSNEAAMKALMNIEGFRNLNQDIETIINKSEAVKKVKKEANDVELSQQAKKELTAEEKEYKTLRKQIQEKLIKFATRIPVFMYLTDYREKSLKDVITQLEPGLFKKVTGLSVSDFDLLVSLGLFNSALMNDAVYKFKRYEDSSLEYTGINKHKGEDIGLYDTVLSAQDYNKNKATA